MLETGDYNKNFVKEETIKAHCEKLDVRRKEINKAIVNIGNTMLGKKAMRH